MYDFILQTILVGSLAVMAFLAARALPRVEPEENPRSAYDCINRWFGNLPLHRFDERVNIFLFKFLKRSRVIVMKLDNRLMHYLDKVKKNGEQTSSPTQELLDYVQKKDE